jgi:hypothetical protein
MSALASKATGRIELTFAHDCELLLIEVVIAGAAAKRQDVQVQKSVRSDAQTTSVPQSHMTSL